MWDIRVTTAVNMKSTVRWNVKLWQLDSQCPGGTGYVHLLPGRYMQQVAPECSFLFKKIQGVILQQTLNCSRTLFGYTLGIWCVQSTGWFSNNFRQTWGTNRLLESPSHTKGGTGRIIRHFSEIISQAL
jgi:hypothetical protein